MSTPSPRSVELFAAAAASVLLAALVWWRYRQHRLQRLFALSALGMGGYSAFLAGLSTFTSEAEAEAWVRATAGLPYFAMYSFFAFAATLARADRERWVRVAGSLGLAAAVADSLARLSGLAPVKLEFHAGQGWFPGPDPVYAFCYLPTLLLLVGGGLALLWRRRRRTASALERTQLTYVFLAFGVGALISLANLHPAWAALAALGPVAYNSIIAYAITRHRLLEIRVLLRHGAVVAGLGVVLGFLGALSLLLSRAAWGAGSSAETFSLVLTALLFTLGFDPLRNLVRRQVDRWLGYQPLDPGAKLLEFSLLFTAHPRLEAFLDAAAEKLSRESGLERCGFLLADRRGHLLPVGPGAEAPDRGARGLEAGSALGKRLMEEPLGLELDGLAWTRLYEKDLPADDDGSLDVQARAFLVLNGAQAAFALRDSGHLLGVLLVGAPRSGDPLSAEQLRFFAALAQQVAQVVANTQLQSQVEQADRLSSLGTLAASLTHEIRNPLASIDALFQLLPSRHQDPQFIERFSRLVSQELARLNRLSEQVLDFAKPVQAAAQDLDLNQLAERTRQLMGYQFARHKVRLELDLAAGGGLRVRGTEAELTQVLVNLLLNALDVSSEGQSVRLRTLAESGWACLRVEDQGPGIPTDELGLVFEPFYSTKEKGTGLGLPTCQRIVQASGGSIQVLSAPGQGAVFEVRLPAASD